MAGSATACFSISFAWKDPVLFTCAKRQKKQWVRKHSKVKNASIVSSHLATRPENHTHLVCGGDCVSGEIELAITLRILAGASHLDLCLWLDICPDHMRTMSGCVVREWLCHCDVLQMNFHDNVLNNVSNSLEIAARFGQKSNGIISGVIGSLDGWLVKIRCPKWWKVKNPGEHHNRKGFHALNVQVIVDRDKRVSWRHIGEKGSTHDSPCFHNCQLGKKPRECAEHLRKDGFCIVGDSACALRSHLMTPCDNAKPLSEEDNFNFFLSSKRICVECAFSEINRRWGILWKPLEGNLSNHQCTIDSCLRSHNLIVNHRLQNEDDLLHNGNVEREELDMQSEDFCMQNPM